MKNNNNTNTQTNNTLNISVLQFAPVWEDKAKNLEKIATLIKACPEKTDLVILPEMATTGFSMNAEFLAEEMDGETVTILSKIAVNKELAICGSFIIQENAAFYNRFLFFHPNGKIDTYDKRHPFTMAGENKAYKAGSERTLIEFSGWKILPQICYDVRFPVWCRNNLNYDLLICVANWPDKRTFVWDTLLKARALENQCYTVGCNRTGKDANDVAYIGHSILIDAKGQVISKGTDKEVILSSTFDRNTQNEFRKAFPVLKDADGFQLF